MMKCNEAGLALIREAEGLRLEAYLDPAGIPTIGYGCTKGVKLGDVITEEIAERLLLQDVARAEADVRRIVTAPLNSNQFSALVSFVFNIGPSKLLGSRTLAALNAHRYLIFADYMKDWNKARVNGKLVPLPGLTKRRQAESALFLRPVVHADNGRVKMPIETSRL